MRWLKPNVRNSLYSLLGSVAGVPSASQRDGLEDCRELMLDTLGATAARDFPQLCRRIRYAEDIVGLWYLRGELMQALASQHGERMAARNLAAITARFERWLPGNMHSRPSPLVG
ncbi:MAG: hypothetical protein V4787_07910 [Pseudomonadota bacterium]